MVMWNKEDEEKFIQMYPTVPTKELSIMFRRSKSSLVTKAYKMGVKKIIREDGLRYIYDNEKIEIVKYGKNHSVSETAKKFKRDYTVVRNILVDGGCDIVVNSRWWTSDEESFLKDNFELGNPEYISAILNRKWRTITKKARSMGMKRINKKGLPHKTPSGLSMDEQQFIRDYCGYMGIWEISKELDRSQGLVEKFCLEENLECLKLRKNPKSYSDEFLLKELQNKFLLLGRCPTSGEIQNDINLPSVDIYYDRFGSFSNACDMAGLQVNIGYYGTLCYSKNGDKCYSSSEQIITNYLIDNGIKYIKEYEYYNIIPDVETDIVMDWYINDVVVEYFGMQKFEKYELKTSMKQGLCKKNNIKIISIFPEDMKYLDKIFQQFINKNP